MKINPILLLIASALTALITFGFYSLNKQDPNQIMITIVVAVFSFITLATLFSLSFGNGASANIKIVSAIFFVIQIISNLIFSFANFTSPTAYIIVSGLILIFYVTISYLIYNSLK